MNLWIRSQDKEELLKINNRIFVKEITNVGFSIENDLCVDDGFISLGIYKTKERALEVLDEIQKFLRDIYIDMISLFMKCQKNRRTLWK